MTFEQFQATKQRETREAYAEKIGIYAEAFAASHVLTYFDGSAYIEDDDGKGYYLILGRSDWISKDLPALERLLFDWCVSEGYFEVTQ
jgi:hypothetical protein